MAHSRKIRIIFTPFNERDLIKDPWGMIRYNPKNRFRLRKARKLAKRSKIRNSK